MEISKKKMKKVGVQVSTRFPLLERVVIAEKPDQRRDGQLCRLP